MGKMVITEKNEKAYIMDTRQRIADTHSLVEAQKERKKQIKAQVEAFKEIKTLLAKSKQSPEELLS